MSPSVSYITPHSIPVFVYLGQILLISQLSNCSVSQLVSLILPLQGRTYNLLSTAASIIYLIIYLPKFVQLTPSMKPFKGSSSDHKFSHVIMGLQESGPHLPLPLTSTLPSLEKSLFLSPNIYSSLKTILENYLFQCFHGPQSY